MNLHMPLPLASFSPYFNPLLPLAPVSLSPSLQSPSLPLASFSSCFNPLLPPPSLPPVSLLPSLLETLPPAAGETPDPLSANIR